MTPLSVYEFGDQLLVAKDLDPVYVMVHHSGLGSNLNKWLIAYWCFYHVGTASWISEQQNYWLAMRQAAGSKEWPRSSERRHFRGQQALNSVAWLEDRGVDELMLPISSRNWTAKELTAYVQTWKGFGPWISFKVADMTERLGMTNVEFDLETAMYDGSPTEAACLLTEQELGIVFADKREAIAYAANAVVHHFSKSRHKAPPTGDRLIGFQEAETILCKWKSHLGGHYRVGEDVAACRRGLLRFARSRTAQALLKGGKKGGLW